MSKIAYIIRPITNGMYNDTYTVYYTNGARRRYTINGCMNKKHFEFIQSATVEAFYSKWTGAHKHDIFRPAPAEEPTAEEPAADQEPEEETTAETTKEDKPMKKRFFYLADIDTTFTVAPMTKKEIISIGQELKELCEFMSHDQTISGYTKAGEFFYYDCSNFDSFKKSDIINAVSVIYSDESGDYYFGGFDINEWGVAGPTEDGSTIIADHENIKEVESADYSETAEEPAADQAEEETTETYSAWCGMIESDVITEEHETLSEAIDEVETKYDKEEQRALGITYCRLLCTAGQWLECLEEKKIEDIYFFDKGRVIYDNRSGNYFRIDSELDEVRGAYWCTMVELDDTGDISAELSAGWMTKSEVNRCTDI